MAKGREDRSSRLLVKVATAINSHGQAAVEKHLNKILVSNDRTALNGSNGDINHRRTSAIIGAICKCMDISEEQLMNGSGKHGRIALYMSYYFIKNNTEWNNDIIARFFKKNSHGSVTYGVSKVLELSTGSGADRANIDLLQKVENAIQVEIRKLTKKNGHGR